MKRVALALACGIVVLAGCSSTQATGPDPSVSTSTSLPTLVLTPTTVDRDSTPGETSGTVSLTTETTESSTSDTTSTGSWPSTLTPAQVVEAQAAITAYESYWALVNRAFQNPGAQDWNVDISKLAADPMKSQFLQVMAGSVQNGQYRTGGIVVHPVVTQVQPALVDITDCVDATDMDYFDNTGKSIKAPDAAGSYFRHVSKVQVAEYVGEQWLVTYIDDDYNTTC